METYLHCTYKNIPGIDTHKMKDDGYPSQDRKKWNWSGASKSSVIVYFLKNKV